MTHRVLVTEDDRSTALLVKTTLTRARFEVDVASNGQEFFEHFEKFNPCVVIVDNVPGLPCSEACRWLRSKPDTSSMPVLVYSALSDDNATIELLNLGADSVIPKHRSPQVLAATIHAIARRLGGQRPHHPRIDAQSVILDHECLVARCGEHQVPLSATEFDILHLLTSTPGVVFTRGEIMSAVRGSKADASPRVVDVLILRLRRKLLPIIDCIRTVRGVGYSYEVRPGS